MLVGDSVSWLGDEGQLSLPATAVATVATLCAASPVPMLTGQHKEDQTEAGLTGQRGPRGSGNLNVYNGK